MENLKGEVMRWKTWQPPNVGDKRIKTKFLIFPKSDRVETRWLEKAKYREIFTSKYIRDRGYYLISWKIDKFIDE